MVKSGEKMFIGLYQRFLEAKGRLAVPAKFREELVEGSVITRGLDGCLFLFPAHKWAEIAGKLRATPLTSADARAFTRLLSYEAFEVDFDHQGRILLPVTLQKFAKLEKEVVVAGGLDRVEIWSAEKFSEYQNNIEKSSDQVAERLSNLEIRI